ncbi:hypothetical protein N7509_005853 [Penicillium cosmopolitanum]|uniref:Uncharacterized protein n=1 Tax=Penicillium cosmopolitanum TaxID=1131564 RepID=A0A9X0BAG7_9EURO|nr:uncharacterized protein N7509_005853 [Penicillium cosmopolitanum]KAJ5397740.1 hypothetical protein N7509_005853 [Penicillium cosmopolitanum]
MAKVNFGESPPTYEFESDTVGKFSRFREIMISELEKMASQLDTPNEGSRTTAFQEQYAPHSESSAIYPQASYFEYVR